MKNELRTTFIDGREVVMIDGFFVPLDEISEKVQTTILLPSYYVNVIKDYANNRNLTLQRAFALVLRAGLQELHLVD